MFQCPDDEIVLSEPASSVDSARAVDRDRHKYICRPSYLIVFIAEGKVLEGEHLAKRVEA